MSVSLVVYKIQAL